MTFDHHIFISYAHTDNYAPPGCLGWVDRFHEQLYAWCIRRFGKRIALRVWRDKRLDPNQLINDELREGIEKSFLFLALNSTNYAASTNCQMELKWFRQQAEHSSSGLVL